MPRIKIWFNEEERYNIFEINNSVIFSYDCKISEKSANRFNRLIEVLEAMQCHLHIKKITKEIKEE